MSKLEDVEIVGIVGDICKEKCYFSTFIDEVTITCSPDGKFDFCGFPIKLCDKLPFCNRIKEMNNGNKQRNKNGINKI